MGEITSNQGVLESSQREAALALSRVGGEDQRRREAGTLCVQVS